MRIVRAELKRLRKEHGALTPEIIVNAARPATSRLHKFFEWDDTAAAEKYRLNQARDLVRRVRVVVQHDGQPTPMRVLVSVEHQGRRSYEEVTEVLARPLEREAFIDQLRRDLEAIVRRYSVYKDLANEIEVVRSAIAALDGAG